MNYKTILLALLILFFTGCAQIPKESVELSATVGRDIAITHKAHIQLATILFDRMKMDINRFVDNTYAPYQINNAMKRQKELAMSNDPKERKKSISLAMNAAFTPEASENFQSKVLKAMSSFIFKIHTDIEQMRSDLLTPLIQQEKEAIGSINRAYQQMHYANSIVTGHLSSVVKIHEVQSDLLTEFGIERDLRKNIGEKVSSVSEKISSLIEEAEKVDGKLENAESTATEIKNTIAELKDKIK